MSAILHNYFRSGTSHRVRIALALKGVDYDYLPVNLRAEEHFQDSFKGIHPQGFVPVLQIDGRHLIQSPAILEWLEDAYPAPALLPALPDDRAYVRAIAALVGCDIHPLNNRRILEFLRQDYHADEDQILTWCQKWISEGFDGLVRFMKSQKKHGRFCFGDQPGLADVYLVPQMDSARRFKLDLSPWPMLVAIDQACAALEAFKQAAPAGQPDAF